MHLRVNERREDDLNIASFELLMTIVLLHYCYIQNQLF